ncbi:hypothetical protein GGI11_000999 [Coemansia sp. RSA 2049]|nr:hypothetical protein GGI11_000999 [Coemansia sp. RSA 2049]
MVPAGIPRTGDETMPQRPHRGSTRGDKRTFARMHNRRPRAAQTTPARERSRSMDGRLHSEDDTDGWTDPERPQRGDGGSANGDAAAPEDSKGPDEDDVAENEA